MQKHMRKEKLYVTGTIRTDRIEKAPLKDLKKFPRGSIDVLRHQANGISIYRWHDNSQVTMATNHNDVLIDTKSKCQRNSSSSKGKIDVPQPSIIADYNNSMGGIDLFDQFRVTHRITIRSKKWYWPIVRFCISGSIVNAWFLYTFLEPKIPQL
ncbi:hypothetical protein NQ314_021157 [Rhamnusium bicolor]|uniref:PiggyBac transposable element-derived protein domain-containing protein n=1 Tax=Rhamnusium bicolor TaxID=1586634 RepID=A0AAV8WKZ4_9CUCU|nr:hypothetical protein NQ314_021157 [Rhamnusium bicolor]